MTLCFGRLWPIFAMHLLRPYAEAKPAKDSSYLHFKSPTAWLRCRWFGLEPWSKERRHLYNVCKYITTLKRSKGQ